MNRQRIWNEETDEEMTNYIPQFDETALSAPSQKRVRRCSDYNATTAMIRAIRLANHQKVVMVGTLCQTQLEDVVTAGICRNPRPHAAANLCSLAEANAEYIRRLILDDYDPYWR